MFLRRKDVDGVQSTGLRDDPFQLDGSYTNAMTERIVTYQVRNPLLGLLSGFVAGNASGLLGIGGGIMSVPVITLGMRVPIKVATGTSALIIGLTTSVGAIIHYANGLCSHCSLQLYLKRSLWEPLSGRVCRARFETKR